MKTMLTAGRFCKKRELHKELWEVANNLFMTNELLKKYEIAKELKTTGLLITPLEAEKRAQEFSKNLIDSNLMISGLLVPWVLEEIKKAC